MIDWHSHILPAVDDGSRDLEESMQMLGAMKCQGVDTVVATPHFLANEESIDEFLQRRDAAFVQLSTAASELGIEILRGAEVKYYPGISRMDHLDKLTIEGTKLLLLEMPMAKWTDFTVRELIELANMRRVKIIMAHIERYIGLQDKGVIGQLCENGILMQVNASFFDRLGSRRKAIKLLDSGYIHFIGSDCHNMTSRPPNIDSAYELIERKLGEDFTSQMIEYGYSVLGR